MTARDGVTRVRVLIVLAALVLGVVPLASIRLRPYVSALEVLDQAVPDLRSRYPQGAVEYLATTDPSQEGTSQAWDVMVQADSTQSSGYRYGYQVGKSIVCSPQSWAAGIFFSLRGICGPLFWTRGAVFSNALLMPLQTQRPPDLVDSREAAEFASREGAATFQSRTGAHLDLMQLQGRRDGGWSWKLHYHSPDASAGLTVQLDGINGALVSYEEN